MKIKSIHVPHLKNAAQIATTQFLTPNYVVLPVSQHIGAPCSPVVKVGDSVKVGDLIADSDAFVSSPIFATVSGTVKEIKDIMTVSGRKTPAIVIESDGLYAKADFTAPEITDKKSLIDAVRKSGAVGLGGAAFPTSVKLSFDKEKTPVDTLLVNGAECEPYICTDHREMLESPVDIVDGIRKILDILEIERAIIGIEGNKPDAIAKMKEVAEVDSRISVKKLKPTYPQGAEKMLVHSCTGRVVMEGELPLNTGCLVMNVTTIGFLSRYFKTGEPLITKRLTVDGDCIAEPENLVVPIGTPISEIIRYFAEKSGDEITPSLVMMGGPMMGICVEDIDAPIVKNNNAILMFKDRAIPETTDCMRCGSCMRACPMGLEPTALEKAYDAKNYDELEKLKVNLCLNCGSCTFVCPAKRNLAQKNQLAKQILAAEKKRLAALKGDE